MSFSRSIVISCAGMGNRLGLGTTKALIDVCGKPLIIRQLEMLCQADEIRIVVGYQAEKVIDVVRTCRDDVVFVYNHEYTTTGTGKSVSIAAEGAADYILTLDGDLLVHPADMERLLSIHNAFVCGAAPSSDDQWMVQCSMHEGRECVSAFSHVSGDYEWTGVSQFQRDKLIPGDKHVFHLLEPMLPLPLQVIRSKEIDTVEDYHRAIKWVEMGYSD